MDCTDAINAVRAYLFFGLVLVGTILIIEAQMWFQKIDAQARENPPPWAKKKDEDEQ